ncbi:MAG: hypothetical protein IKD89_08670 [Clostridia bacterium]|nr:hypothetical protein [Clostridia bacterium]
MDVRMIPIEETPLSVRSKNALRRAGIHTVGQMLECTEESLMSIQNLGKKSSDEILAEKKRYLLMAEYEDKNDDPELPEEEKKRITEYLEKSDVGIDVLDAMSVRAFNILTLNGYDKLHHILFLSRRKLSEIPGLDEKTAAAIETLCRDYLLKNKSIMLAEEDPHEDAADVDILTLCGIQPYKGKILEFIKANDKGVDKLKLTRRNSNALLRGGLEKLSDIIFLTYRDLDECRGLSSDGINEIITKRNEYLLNNEERIRAYCAGDKDALISDDSIRALVLDLYKKARFKGFSLNEMRERLPSHIAETRLKKTLGALLAEKQLEYVDFRCYRIYPSVLEYLDSREDFDDRTKDILRRRLNGDTLDEIGKDYGVTRERVRQLILKGFRKLTLNGKNVIDEDYYRYFYQTYEFDKTDAADWLGIPKYVFNYYEMAGTKKGTKALKYALEDTDNLDAGLRLKIKNYLNRNKIFIDGMWVSKKRSALEEVVARRFCTDEIDFDEFARKYNEFLKSEGIGEDEDLCFNEKNIKTRKNSLSKSRFILWKQFEKIRYYDIDARDYTELLEELNLEAYENIEISALKLMREHPDIMAKYDIRDQYELHNLLRKIIPKGSFHDFSCERMPMLKFGKFNRDRALFELMVNNASIDTAGNASISADRLCAIIEAEYGYTKEITMSTYLVPLYVYYHNGMFTIERKTMSDENRAALEAALEDDFYYIDELKTIYSQAVPGADTGEINPFNLKSMGFIVLSTYAIRNYDSAEAYFKSILTSGDIVDITEFRKRFTYVSAFSNILMDLKRELEIIEFEPNRIINIRRLEAADVTKDTIRDYCDDVYEFIGEGKYFTIQSLRGKGFDSELFELGFSDWFYANLLISDRRLTFVKMLGNIVFYSGDIALSVKSFVELLVNKAGSIDVYDLLNDLKETYGCISVDRSDIIEKMKGTAIYYDRILDRFYANSDVYDRELEETEEII